jgi:dienelactone hydrolase
MKTLPLLLLCLSPAWSAEPGSLPGTKPLTQTGDLSALQLAGIEKFLQAQTAATVSRRQEFWKRDPSSRDAYERSIAPNRNRLGRLLGVVDERLPIRELEYVSGSATPGVIARTDRFTVRAVRWPVLEGVEGEGLLLTPEERPLARVIALPDADQTPEMIAGLAPGLPPEAQWARRLAENGCQVVIPVLIDRKDTWSGQPDIWMTNLPHREWIYRPAFDLGRHIIGYEVQKVLALVDWFRQGDDARPIGVAGYGEGGLIAFNSAALDSRIAAALVSGYFDQREQVYQEPIYRNVFGLLTEFGDAEIASLIAPRPLIIEHSRAPEIEGPPPAREGRRNFAAPGRLRTPSLDAVRREVQRARAFFPQEGPTRPAIQLVGEGEPVRPGSEVTLRAFLLTLGLPDRPLLPAGKAIRDLRANFDPDIRMERQVRQLVEHTQVLLRRSAQARQTFWARAKATSVAEWEKACVFYRRYLGEEVIGRFSTPRLPSNPRARQFREQQRWIAHEVMLDVFPDVFLWGYLLVPRDLKPGEKRPVVVCQHGLEGLPDDVITEDPKSQAYPIYKGFAVRLAERGFVVFAPHHYYRGGNRFRQLQRLAYPIQKTLFSVVVAQHEQLLSWLKELPFVDASRIGFYGLSYGGFSAMRLGALVPGYAVVINSAEFNDMAPKKVSVHDRYSYPFYGTYEVNEWDLINTFNYSDLAGLIAPRAFMVERGHDDTVAPDEWVAAEYARVRRLYVKLGLADRTAIEFFDGPHAINGVGTFAFLHKHLNWPEKKP